jgi:hypothetical protein
MPARGSAARIVLGSMAAAAGVLTLTVQLPLLLLTSPAWILVGLACLALAGYLLSTTRRHAITWTASVLVASLALSVYMWYVANPSWGDPTDTASPSAIELIAWGSTGGLATGLAASGVFVCGALLSLRRSRDSRGALASIEQAHPAGRREVD